MKRAVLTDPLADPLPDRTEGPLSSFQREYAERDRRRPGTYATILRSFELTEIGRYFPDYQAEVRRRVGNR